MEMEELTRFEQARLLGARAIKINVFNNNKETPIDIAYKELKEGVLPLDVIKNEELNK